MPKYAEVIINFATTTEIDRIFTYEIKPLLLDKIQIGHRVKVPFGRHNAPQLGYVIGILDEIEHTDYEVKAIYDRVDERPLMSKSQLDMARFMVDYYGASFAASIDAIVPAGLTAKPFEMRLETRDYIVLTEDTDKVRSYIAQNTHKKSFAKQQEILEYLLEHKKVLFKAGPSFQDWSVSSVKTLRQNEMLQILKQEIKQMPDPINHQTFKVLTSEQLIAKDKLMAALQSSRYQTMLLDGVTGSGKTEIFLYVIKEVIEKGGSAIVLVPEIALTRQTLQRFEERFGNRVALTHSRMTPKERQRLYVRAQMGEVNVIIGPRSAVFMPFENLKLIIIDEEHESTYKSENAPKYHAVDMAQMRMQREKGVVLLASATPSMETYQKCITHTYEKLTLTQRIGKARLPEVIVADMRIELKSGNNQVISRVLFEAIRETLTEGKQVMLLINRRGHSTFINCRSCGHVIKCEHCDVSMTYHLSSRQLECHHCGKTEPVPETCPSCGSKHIRFFGSGTEKVEQYLREHFSQYGIGRMDLDTTTGKEGHSKILAAFEKREINLLIGTQMIAKGHDFKEVTLVGIISADMSLYMQDFRSNERSFQLITQAMGRAGRGNTKGKVIIQTYNPDHIVIEKIKNNQKELFYSQEIKNRQLMGYPPFTHIFTLLVTGKNEEEVIHTAHDLAQYYRHYSEKGKTAFRVIGPSTAVIGKLVDEYRWRIIILSENREKLLVYGKYCLQKFKTKSKSSNIKIQWDMDPLSMM
jgi:primosomal protein N' (replication factor Y)